MLRVVSLLPPSVRITPFYRRTAMKKFQSRLNVAQAVICAGVCCVVFACISNFVGVVYAQSCPNQVPDYVSLCVTTPFPVCPNTSTASVCNGASEWDVESGWFQCVNLPLSGTICFDSNNSAPCYTVYGCRIGTSGFCFKNTEGANQPYEKVTKSWDFCPG